MWNLLMPEPEKSIGNLPTSAGNPSKSFDGYNVGSKKWHFALAAELYQQAQKETDKEQASYIKERADFHRLVGQHQK